MNTSRIRSVLLFLSVIVGVAYGTDHGDHGHDHGKEDAEIDDGCPETEYQFDAGEYIEYLPEIPILEEATFCTFVKTNDKGIIPGVVGSYGTDNNKKLIAIIGVRSGKVKLIIIIISGKTRKIPAPLKPSTEYHVCLTVNTRTGEVHIHVNGNPDPISAKFPKLKPLPGGGKMLIGKAQHDDSLTFTGRIRNFMMWDRVLEPSTITEIYTSHKCAGDEVVVLQPQYVMFHGLFVYKEDCLATEYTFDNIDQAEYLESIVPFPQMDYFTVCVIATTDAKGMIPGTFGSYATKDEFDILVAGGEMLGRVPVLRIMVHGQAELLESPLMPNTEYRFCVRFHIPQSQVYTFINGQQIRVIQYDNLKKVPGGGKLIIGQRQTCYKEHGACFKDGSAYSGTMKNFMIWNRALSDEEIKSIAVDNQCPVKAAITLAPQNVLSAGRLIPSEACQNLEYIYDNTGDKEEYLESLDTLPNMKYFTTCITATSNKFGVIPGTAGSYVTNDAIDIISAGGEMGEDGIPRLRLVVNGEVKLLQTPLMPNTQYSFCLIFHLPHGHVFTYINGKFIRQVDFKPGSIPGGGKVIVGQRQTCYKEHGACFDRERAYNGKMRDFMVWDRALSNEEIKAIATSNECPMDAVITTKPDRVFPSGKFYTYQACPPTAFNLRNKRRALQYVEVTKQFEFGEYFTICTQVLMDNKGRIAGAIGTYATSDEDINTISARGQVDNGEANLRVAVKQQEKVVSAQFAPKTEYGFCLSYHLPHNHVFTYVNGMLGTEISFSDLGSISAPGKLIIGQQQTCLGNCFERKYAFNGRIRNFMIWNRILSTEEMKAYSESDECPTDHIVDLTPANAKFVKTTVQG